MDLKETANGVSAHRSQSAIGGFRVLRNILLESHGSPIASTIIATCAGVHEREPGW